MKVLSYLETCKTYTISENQYGSAIIGLVDIPIANIMCWDSMEKVTNFYSQPFRPELIIELFEGWEHFNGMYSTGNFLSDSIKPIIDFSMSKISNKYATYNTEDRNIFIFPRTLDLFVCNCQDAGIELEWRLK